jgi:hypothetical protein
MSATHEQRIRRAAVLVTSGLAVELLSTAWWTPLTFVLFVMVGVPLVLAGIFLYATTVWRILKERRAL